MFLQPFESKLQASYHFNLKLANFLKTSTLFHKYSTIIKFGEFNIAIIQLNLQSIWEFHHKLPHKFTLLLFVFIASSLFNDQENDINIFFQLSSMVNKITNPKFKILKNLNPE